MKVGDLSEDAKMSLVLAAVLVALVGGVILWAMSLNEETWRLTEDPHCYQRTYTHNHVLTPDTFDRTRYCEVE